MRWICKRKWSKRARLVTTFGCCVGLALLTHGMPTRGQTPSPTLSTAPIQPTARESIRVALNRFAGGCVIGPTSYRVVVAGNVVTIEYTYPAGATSLAGGTCTERATLSPLPSGIYRLEWKEGIANSQLTLVASLNLSVSEIFAIPIPTVQMPLIAALVALIIVFSGPKNLTFIRSSKGAR